MRKPVPYDQLCKELNENLNSLRDYDKKIAQLTEERKVVKSQYTKLINKLITHLKNKVKAVWKNQYGNTLLSVKVDLTNHWLELKLIGDNCIQSIAVFFFEISPHDLVTKPWMFIGTDPRTITPMNRIDCRVEIKMLEVGEEVLHNI